MSPTKLPVGIQDFEKLVTGDYVYVDKTEYLHQIISAGTPCFLSRPRRFGKSMTISTLQAIFQAKRELFKGQWIDNSDWDWQEYPVIRLDMSRITNRNADMLEAALIAKLNYIAQEYNFILQGVTAADHLENLIRQLAAKKNKVVVLIDEYDKPIIDRIETLDLAEANRDILKEFYGTLKSEDGDIKLIFITGVTKFSKVSIFSGINNLVDLSMTNDYSALAGYTADELILYFKDEINELAKTYNISYKTCLDRLQTWYNGYQFSKRGEKVYNPFSILNALKFRDFSAYWFQTGTPTFLLNLIAKHQFDPNEFERIEVGSASFQDFEIHDIPILPLLYQTGYLTVKSYDPGPDAFTLSYPNREVQQAFTESLITYFATEKANSSKYLVQLYHNLNAPTWNPDEFIALIKKIMALIPYDLYIKQEKYFHSLFYLIMRLTNIKLNAEFKTQLGRADACLAMKDKIIIFEFKLNKTAAEGIEQIKEKKYYEMFLDCKLPIYLVGVNFDGKTRTIDDTLVELRVE